MDHYLLCLTGVIELGNSSFDELIADYADGSLETLSHIILEEAHRMELEDISNLSQQFGDQVVDILSSGSEN